jgi:hypothetical protein
VVDLGYNTSVSVEGRSTALNGEEGVYNAQNQFSYF